MVEMQLDLMGININTERKAEVLAILAQRYAAGKKTFIATPYSEFFYYRCTHYDFRRALEQADLLIPDGISVLWLAYYLSLPLKARSFYLKIFEAFWQLIYTNFQILFAPAKIKSVIPEKISGSDFFWDLMNFAAQRKLKIFLLGGFGATPKIVADKIKIKYPGLQIAGFSNAGPEEASTAAQINASGADLVAVAYGPVRQEVWIAKHRSELNAKIYIGVGGTFDYIAGVKMQPPRFVRKSGLEWLYRLVTQGRFRRIWIAVYVFLRGSLRYKVFYSMPFRQNVVGVIINRENKVFVGSSSRNKTSSERPGEDTSHWMFPQGGIEPHENPDVAVFREMAEETGLTDLILLGSAKQRYSYIWPHMIRPLWSNRLKFKGQLQTIYFLRLKHDQSVKLEAAEFEDYRWAEIENLKKIIHPIRREMLEIVLAEINQYI